MSMQKQNRLAIRYGYSFLETPSQVKNFVSSGYLVKISDDRHLELHDVSYPYARSEVKLFLERLSAQYHVACGEKLTVTSLTRPIEKQPVNASESSVHPTGMAVDLRIPGEAKCRSWLEKTLLSLEADDILDVTRERHPAHYHVAVFTKQYENYVASLGASTQQYVVRRGDSLSRIATRAGVSVAQLRSANALDSDLLRIGQKLDIPVSSPTMASSASGKKQVATVSEITHKVHRGETLWRIAHKYGTSVNNLRRQNGLTDDVLQVGQLIRVSISL